MRKSLELQSQAIDEVMTTMSQIAMLDHALGYTALRPHAEVTHFEDDTEERFDELFAGIHTPDIDAEQLDKMASVMVGDIGSIAAERFVQDAIQERVKQRRANLVAEQIRAAKVLNGQRLHVIPHVSNIVRRLAPSLELPPIRAEEAITLRVGSQSGVCFPNTHRWKAYDSVYRRYTGYSLAGALIDKREGKGHVHYVSLVALDGTPQVTMMPAR
jgi:hypothetical protein